MAKNQPNPQRKPPSKASSQPASPAGGLIDTSLAANAAAAFVRGKVNLNKSASNAPRKESASFKQLKQSLNKPASQLLGGMLDTTAPQKKAENLPRGGKQVGRRQTMGGDATRANVPRRTAG